MSGKDNIGGLEVTDIKGTKTEENLIEAFNAESRTRSRYNFFAAIAREDGFENIAETFKKAADNEKEHARVWFKLLCGGKMPGTADNLKFAIENENKGWNEMYTRMAAEAREEGFNDIAFLFESIGAVEKEHEERFSKLLTDIENDTVFTKMEKKSVWICRCCGYSTDNEHPPEKCPVCEYPKAYFTLQTYDAK